MPALPVPGIAIVSSFVVLKVSRIIERGLVKDGRLVRLAVMLRDRPGQLARLTALVAEIRANVLHILHDRAFSRARLGETEVEVTLETTGREHIEQVKRHLTEAGYAVHEIVRAAQPPSTRR